MTVVNEVVMKTYQGNGLVSEWPIPFQLPADGAQYVRVYVAEPYKEPVQITSGYSVDLSVGVVKYPVSGTPLAAGYKITLRRQLPYTQETDLHSQGPFDPETIEDAHDLSTMQIQQIAEEVGRAVKVAIGSEKTAEDYSEELFAAAFEASNARNESVAAKESAEAASVASAQSALEAGNILQDIKNEGANAVSNINTATASGISQMQSELDGLADRAASAADRSEVAAANAAESSRGLEFDWRGTELGVRREGDASYAYVDLSDNVDYANVIATLGLKADQTEVDDALSLKADTSTVNTALALKADTSTVNTSLMFKADKADFDALVAQVAAQAFPVGTVFEFAAEAPPEGALVGNGSLVLIEDFPELFSVVGYTHTPSLALVPPGYFYLPDYRGYFLRGHNPSGSRKFGSEQQDALQNITGSFGLRTLTSAALVVATSGAVTASVGAGTGSSLNVNTSGTGLQTVSINAADSARTATETRPVNKTVLICIKY